MGVGFSQLEKGFQIEQGRKQEQTLQTGLNSIGVNLRVLI